MSGVALGVGCRSTSDDAGALFDEAQNAQQGGPVSALPESEPTDFFSCESPAGEALESYRTLANTDSTEAARLDARATVDALDSGLVTSCLLDTFSRYDAEGAAGDAVDTMFYMSHFPSAGLRDFVVNLIEVRGVAELQEIDALHDGQEPGHHSHKYDGPFAMTFWAMRVLENGYNREGVVEAMADLVRIATDHPYAFVRHRAIVAIERSGTAADRDALRAEIRSEDAFQLNPPDELAINDDVLAPEIVSEDDEPEPFVADN